MVQIQKLRQYHFLDFKKISSSMVHFDVNNTALLLFVGMMP